jgi:hypothetical protein
VETVRKASRKRLPDNKRQTGDVGFAWNQAMAALMRGFFRPLSPNPFAWSVGDGRMRFSAELCGAFAKYACLSKFHKKPTSVMCL